MKSSRKAKRSSKNPHRRLKAAKIQARDPKRRPLHLHPLSTFNKYTGSNKVEMIESKSTLEESKEGSSDKSEEAEDNFNVDVSSESRTSKDNLHGKLIWSFGLELESLLCMLLDLISLLKEKVLLVFGFKSRGSIYNTKWFYKYDELEIKGLNLESVKMEDFDTNLYTKYWLTTPSKRSKSNFSKVARILLKDYKDLAFHQDIMDLYISCYGGVLDNGSIRKKFLMVALGYLYGKPHVL